MIDVTQPKPFLVVVRFVGRLSDQELDRYFAELGLIHARRQRFGLVLDAGQASLPTAMQLRRQAQWLSTRAADIERDLTAIAFVIASPAIRGALKAVWWLSSSRTLPHRVFAEPEAAQRWAEAQTLAELQADASGPTSR